jgi:hypothetical protein
VPANVGKQMLEGEQVEAAYDFNAPNSGRKATELLEG